MGALPWRADLLTSGQVPTNYGAGGTQDPITIANRDQFVLYSSPTVVRPVTGWSGSSGLTVRYAAHRSFSFEVLQPKAVSCLSGFGLGTPTFA